MQANTDQSRAIIRESETAQECIKRSDSHHKPARGAFSSRQRHALGECDALVSIATGMSYQSTKPAPLCYVILTLVSADFTGVVDIK